MKFRVKVTLVVISLLSLLFGIGGAVLINTTFQNSIEREKNVAQKSYNMILNTLILINDASDWSSSEDISEVIKRVSIQEDIFCATRLSSDSEIVYSEGDTVSDLINLKENVDRTHVACRVVEGDKGYFLQLCGSFYVGEKTMYLDIAYDISAIYSFREEQQKTYITVFIILVLLSAVISYILAYLLTKPMVKLKDVAIRITEGDYEQRSNIKSSDEIGSLSCEFDKMADTLVEQMEKQNQFIGNFTHEIKTPMTSIIGYADLIRRDTLSKEDSIKAANYIFSEGRRLERLSVKMLELLVADNGTTEFTKQEPAVLIRKIIDSLKAEYSKQSIDFEYLCEDGVCLLEPDFFKSLIINILENSRRAMVNGGKISIKCTMLPEGCKVKISDNGGGIPKEALNHIKEAFYRVDKARSRSMGGAGLGLALCDRIVRLHNGKMCIESTLGVGTTVTFTLMGGRV